ncbi:M20/M25/M40 family metallo-hydrolase [uncultured Dokdonia sp.]|uniref:M20/M25/M40 family metallo-hydrolase n=1 Tax=uncultured Dokdonia sp. TaxID=575653 RepID=UPI00261BF1FE|nr:M20/M25/M40 family metallo-hydrolase [uncultured Dokdonia sp.]
MKYFYTLSICLLISLNVTAQHQDGFYATMSLHHAKALVKDAPNDIEILSTFRNEVAVWMTETGSHKLHDRILTHGPGYIYRNSEEEAITAIQNPQNILENNTRAALNFSITEDATVIPTLDLIQTQNIEDHILELENYGTRYHNRASATQAAVDLKAKWEEMAAEYGRTDVSVRLFEHSNTQMPSVILTITGAEIPEEYVIVGGHLDSTSNQGNDNAPGADDDASGIATITEATRALFEVGFVPKRTIEVMAYAAEEIGLVGSNEIASEYASNDVNVVAVSQFDMTLFNGSSNDVSFITDFTSGTLTNYMMSLLDHYNASGDHQVTYSTSVCNYGCSDHASWTGQGYLAAFPFEANFGQHNGNIHSTGDMFSLTNTASHATKFAKLCAEFLIEVAKNNEALSVNDVLASSIYLTINDGMLSYDLTSSQKEVKSIQLYSIKGQEVFATTAISDRDQVALPTLSTGIYIATITTENSNTPIVKKLIVR